MPIAALLPAFLEAEPQTSSPDLTRYVLVCAAMLCLVFVLAFGFRRLMAGNLKRRAAARSLQVVDMLPMGGKQRLVVVRCYDRHFLIGLGDKEVSSIAELEAGSDELPTSSVLDLPGESSAIHRRGFAGALENVLAKWKRPLPQAQNKEPAGAPVPVVAPAPRRRPQPVQPAEPALPSARVTAQLAKKKQVRAKWNREEGILG